MRWFHGLTGADELLGEQMAQARGGLDRPGPPTKRLGPGEQLLDLPAGRSDLGPAELCFGAVDRHRNVRRLVRVDAR